jgi:dynein heavy chain
VHQIPVYKTPERAGVLSSTGQSTNFLMHMRLPMPTGTDAAKWLLQGAAVLCSVDE